RPELPCTDPAWSGDIADDDDRVDHGEDWEYRAAVLRGPAARDLCGRSPGDDGSAHARLSGSDLGAGWIGCEAATSGLAGAGRMGLGGERAPGRGHAVPVFGTDLQFASHPLRLPLCHRGRRISGLGYPRSVDGDPAVGCVHVLPPRGTCDRVWLSCEVAVVCE